MEIEKGNWIWLNFKIGLQILFIFGTTLQMSTSGSKDDDASYQTKAISKLIIANWQKAFEKLKLTAKTENQIAHLAYLLDQIKNPDTIKKTVPKAMAPGAPIGCDDEF